MYKKLIIIFIILCSVTSAAFASETILTKAKKYLPQVTIIIDRLWPTMPKKEVIFAQIERESAWKERATLKTSRELGRGFAQITIAYDKNHKERFNNFKNAVQYKELKNWNWKKDPYNVQYQLEFLVLFNHQNFNMERKYMINDEEALKVMLVDFNAGSGRTIIRRAYAKSIGIKSDRWTGGLELACRPSEQNTKIYGESLCSMVNAYPNWIWKHKDKYIEMVKATN